MFGLTALKALPYVIGITIIVGLGIALRIEGKAKEKALLDLGSVRSQLVVAQELAVANARAAERLNERCREGNALAGDAAAQAERLRSELNQTLREVQGETSNDRDLLNDIFNRVRTLPGGTQDDPSGAGNREPSPGPAAPVPGRTEPS